MESLFLVISAAGTSRDRAKGTREQPYWDEHAAFIDRLVEEGFSALGGPLLDEGGAMLVVRADSLADADAVVQFTAYRRVVRDKGEPQGWWYGHYVLLRAPSHKAHSVPGAERFTLVVIGREDWQVEPALEMLGTTLSRALGPTPYPQKGEAL